MVTVKLSALPNVLTFNNEPKLLETNGVNTLSMAAGPQTDWFYDPAGRKHSSNAPVALFSPPDEACLLSAKVMVGFNSTFDAGVLFIYADDERWAKLCLEYAPTDKAMVVSVVTRGKSDDCNSVYIDGNSIYLRLYRQGDRLAFHYSEDGEYWHMVRHFTIEGLQNLRIGFSAQAPTGEGCLVEFSEINYRAGELSDIRNGE
jgi:regulation of enolase protein 1 (concanavalin A-like superfamily)